LASRSSARVAAPGRGQKRAEPCPLLPSRATSHTGRSARPADPARCPGLLHRASNACRSCETSAGGGHSRLGRWWRPRSVCNPVGKDAGARVVAVAGSDERIRLARKLDCDHHRRADRGGNPHRSRSRSRTSHRAHHSGTAILCEDRSRHTLENLFNAREDLRGRGLWCVLLVSDPLHLARAAALATGLGLKVATSPAAYPASTIAWAARAIREPSSYIGTAPASPTATSSARAACSRG
jgi:hypothetical protein